MKDEAVSPVVAFMLLLMIVVSFISVLNAYYIPSLKQQAEIEHLHNVEQSFLKLSPDILQALTFRQNMRMNEPIQLGGGEVYFSPVRSSGYLEVNTTIQKEPLTTIILNLNGNKWKESSISSTNITYRPVGNFWINQGYEWRDGVLNITKGKRWAYLHHTDELNVSMERDAYIEMFSPRIILEEYQKNITSIVIDFIQIENPGSKRYTSSNGAAKINIQLKKSEPEFQYIAKHNDKIQFESTNQKINLSFIDSFVQCTDTKKNNVRWFNDNYTLVISKDQDYPVPNVTIKKWGLSIEVDK